MSWGQLSAGVLERGGRPKEASKGMIGKGLVPKKIEQEAEELMVPGPTGQQWGTRVGRGPGAWLSWAGDPILRPERLPFPLLVLGMTN